MMLVDFDLEDGRDVFVNAELVAALIPRPEGGTIIRLAGRPDELVVAEHIGDVVEGLRGTVR